MTEFADIAVLNHENTGYTAAWLRLIKSLLASK
jgi:hypothetical protein